MPVPKINVKIKTPSNKDAELYMYSSKKVSFKILEYSVVSSKKLKETVAIGIKTTKEMRKEL